MEETQLSGDDIIRAAPLRPAGARMDHSAYSAAIARALENPDGHWRMIADRLDWILKPTEIKAPHGDGSTPMARWYADGVLNASVNCLDRHLATRGDQLALIWENDTGGGKAFTYRQLHAEVCRWANVLKARGVRKGDRVSIFLPRVPAAAASILACARIGAVHSLIFSGFPPKRIAACIQNSGSRLVITADEGICAGKTTPLKRNLDEALEACPEVRDVIVLRRTNADVPMMSGRDAFYPDLKATVSDQCDPEPMGADDTLCLLHAFNSSGRPSSTEHATGGYLAWASYAHEAIFSAQPDHVFWGMEDMAWAGGVTNALYAPLANGITTVIYEGSYDHPDVSRIWDIFNKRRVDSAFSTKRTIRQIAQFEHTQPRPSPQIFPGILAILDGPVDFDTLERCAHIAGDERVPIVKIFGDVEGGTFLASSSLAPINLEADPGLLPLPGVTFEIVTPEAKLIQGPGSGELCISDSWPGQPRPAEIDVERFTASHFTVAQDRYSTGEACRRDGEGGYWITGRADHVIRLSGHSFGPAELENVLLSHPDVAEAAFVSHLHPERGQELKCFVALYPGVPQTDILQADLKGRLRREIGVFAVPNEVRFISRLPRTHPGEISRSALRMFADGAALGESEALGLADTSVPDEMRGDSAFSATPTAV